MDARYTDENKKTDRVPIDLAILNDLEVSARDVSDSLQTLLLKLRSNMYEITKITVDGMRIYHSSVMDICESLDKSVHSMYTLIAKCDEIDKKMEALYELAKQIKEFQKILTDLENEWK